MRLHHSSILLRFWLIALGISVSGLCQAQMHRFVWLPGSTENLPVLPSQVAQRVHAAGFNGVVFPALVEGRTCYPSQIHPPKVVSATAMAWLEECRGQGLQVAIYASTLVQGGDLARAHPEWLSTDALDSSGVSQLSDDPSNEAGGESLFFDPGIPRMSEFMLGLLSESLKQLKPNWLILDTLRYPIPDGTEKSGTHWEQSAGYHLISRKAFEREQGVDPAVLVKEASKTRETLGEERFNQLRRAWDDWRRQRVTSFLSGVREMLQREHPGCRLACVGYPDPVYARDVLFQDWPAWIRSNLLDALILPNYSTRQDGEVLVDILPADLRSKIWISSQVRGDHSSDAAWEAPIRSGRKFLGMVLFDALQLPSPDRGPNIAVHWSQAASLNTEPIDNQPILVADSTETPRAGERVSLEGIRALYAFQPDAAPFKGLTPNQVVSRLADSGFNTVFGGSSSPQMRRALQAARFTRFVEIPLFVGEKHWQKDPDCQPVARNGRKVKKQGWYAPVCPNTPWLREEKLQTILRIVRDQEIDGVWLDFIRFPVFWEETPPFLAETCFCPVCLKSFEAHLQSPIQGSTVAEKAEWILSTQKDRWHRWRADSILDYVRKVRDEVKKVSPKTLIGAFVIPWREDEHDQALYRIAGQDLAGFGKIVDALSPMLYFRELGRPPGWVAERISEIDQQVDAPVLPIVQCFDLPDRLPDADLTSGIDQGRRPPSRGVILFSQKHLETGGRWDLVRQALVK